MKRIKSQKYSLILFFIIGILIGLTILIFTPKEEEAFTAFDVPSDAQFVSFNEGKVVPLSFVKDEIYVLNMFATWCESCVKEYPEIGELSKYVPVYGVSINDSMDDMKEFLAKKGNHYQDVLLDGNGDAMRFFGTDWIPELFLVKNGRVIYRVTGKLTKEILHQKLLPKVSR